MALRFLLGAFEAAYGCVVTLSPPPRDGLALFVYR
jgi:hypothetical protein